MDCYKNHLYSALAEYKIEFNDEIQYPANTEALLPQQRVTAASQEETNDLLASTFDIIQNIRKILSQSNRLQHPVNSSNCCFDDSNFPLTTFQ